MKNYRKFAIDLAYQAGTLMRKNFCLGMKKTLKEHDKSPLTISDIAINQIVLEAIAKEFPTHSLLSEEQSNIKRSKYVWICDPIDGTIPFSSGVPISSFSLALTENGVPILGVIYDPFMDRMFVGEKGKGAFLNNKKISVSTINKIENQILYIGWWKYSAYDFLRVRKELVNKGCKIMDFCSFVYAGSLLAVGEFSAVIYGDRYPWDGAAVKVLVEEAGGLCTDIMGNDQQYDKDINGFIATNGNIHKELLDLVKKTAIKNTLY